MTKTAAAFAKETELCAAFIEAVDTRRWIAYSESCGWDILLVRKSDGAQIGIEAKLKLNVSVVCQALPSWDGRSGIGPDYRAVLVPGGDVQNGLGQICAALGVTVISFNGNKPGFGGRNAFNPYLPEEHSSPPWSWHQWAPCHRHEVPEYVPDVKAGSSSPMALTRWKIKAIKLAIVLETRPITRDDFKAVEIDAQRWTDPHSQWLTLTPQGYVKGPQFPDFKAQHPRNYEEIKADRAKWEWQPSAFLPHQGLLALEGRG